MDAILVERAEAFARRAHRDQKRKYTGEPYWHHCREVAQIVTDAGGSVEMICAAWLHDTVEDCGIEIEQIRTTFGDRVAALVETLTNSTPDKGNRKARKELDRARLAAGSPEAQTIKLADLISNTSSIVERDPDFAALYLREKAALLDVMTDGDPALYERAKFHITNTHS